MLITTFHLHYFSIYRENVDESVVRYNTDLHYSNVNIHTHMHTDEFHTAVFSLCPSDHLDANIASICKHMHRKVKVGIGSSFRFS